MEKELNVICNNSTFKCTVRRFSNTVGFTQPCNGVARTIFEDLSKNSVDILITVTNFTPLPCVMTVIIEFKNGETLERVVPADVTVPGQGSFPGVLTLEFKSVKRVQIRCDGNPLGFCSGSLSVDKFFCACCSDKKDEKCECGKYRKHSNDDCGCDKKKKEHEDDCGCKKGNKYHKESYKFDENHYCSCHEQAKW